MNTRLLKNRLFRRLEDGRRLLPEESFVGTKCLRILSVSSFLPFIILYPEVSIPLLCLFGLLLLINHRTEQDDDFSKALTTPTHSQSEITFFQTPLISNVNEIAPKGLRVGDGMCYGFIRIWHCYDYFGWEDKFFHEIKKLENVNQLSVKQKQSLQFLQIGQKSQDRKKLVYRMHIEGKTINTQKTRSKVIKIPKEKSTTTAIKEIVEDALKLALTNLGALVEIGIYDLEDGHSLGIIAHSDSMGLTINYFDPNYHKVSFETLKDAKENIFNFINYNREYYSWLNRAKADGSCAFDLQVYKVKNSKIHSSSSIRTLDVRSTEKHRASI